MDLMKALTSQYMKQELPEVQVGDTVRVHVKIKEGSRERIQIFEGTVIAKKHGGIEETITVRRISYGVGCEKVFPLHAPNVVNVECVRHGKVRRAKLYYLRSRVGKGAKVRRLPLNDEQRTIIDDALRARGIAGVAGSDPETPLLVNLGRGRNAHGPMTRSGLYVVLTKFLEEVALDVASERPMDAAKLRASSTHWLRHTFAVNALTEMSVNVVQAAMGHASVATTGRYLSPEEEAMSEAMEKMKAL